MGIGRTLSGIVLLGAVGAGGYFIGKGADQDKDYNIKRDGTEVYLQVKPTNESYKIQTFGSQTVFGNSNQVNTQYKTILTIEITDLLSKKMSGNSIDKTVAGK
jgi:hypothetical protein